MMKSSLVFLGVFLAYVFSVFGKLSRPSVSEGIDGAQIFRVSFKDDSDTAKFEDAKNQVYFDVIHRTNSNVDILVKSTMMEGTKNALKSASLEYTVLTSNLQKQIEAESPKMTKQEQTLQGTAGHKLTFTHYHSLGDMYEYLDYLTRTFKSFVSMRVIGKTLEGKQIRALKISSGNKNASSIWIDGGTHAREWITHSTVLYITSQLVEHRDKLPPKMKEFNYYIVPCLNPDGYEFSRLNASTRLWRKNRRPGKKCDGVDINRNYDAHWGGGGASTDECEEDYRGPAANSELETQAITSYLSKKARRFKGFLSFHSYSQVIIYPYCYEKKLPSNAKDLQRVGELAANRIKEITGAKYEVGSTAILLYAASGVAIDWAQDKGIKYVFTVELRDTGDKGFVLPPSEILPCGKEGFEVVKTVAEA